MVEINEAHRRLAGDETVVSVGRIPELRRLGLRPGGGDGAGSAPASRTPRLARPPLATLLPALGQAARTVGSPQIRNAATIGGNLATCSPAGDGLPVLAAARRHCRPARRPTAPARLPVGEFMTGVKRTALGPGELITAVTVPVLDGWQGYAKVGVRNAMVIAIAGACLAVDTPGRSVRVALGSVGADDRPRAGSRGLRRERRRLVHRHRRRRRRRPLRIARRRRGAPDRRPPRQRRLPPPGDRGARRAPPATGVPGDERASLRASESFGASFAVGAPGGSTMWGCRTIRGAP